MIYTAEAFYSAPHCHNSYVKTEAKTKDESLNENSE